ncbi:uncharacterized protein LOC129601236 [Paramacrobiotus metropolitanus]|uniref:uncharacterized protein LOC129601236 n=1 Tax=Paramacrobiotus metropolitanus TaxID=2943436 RepID=UPI0024457487|nr:uncharacterized protein LOC129601236 [Paramacrobiotus metropolitanus]
MPAVGHSLFQALSSVLFSEDKFHLLLRLATVDALATHFTDFLPHVRSLVKDKSVGLLEVVFRTAVVAAEVSQKSNGSAIHLFGLATALQRPICSYRGFFQGNQPENWEGYSAGEVEVLIRTERRPGKKHYLFLPINTPSSATEKPVRVLHTIEDHYLACIAKQAGYEEHFMPTVGIPAAIVVAEKQGT